MSTASRALQPAAQGAALPAWVFAGLLVAACVAAYWPALHAGWIWDDDSYVTANAVVQSADGWWRAWIPGETPQYYPLVFASFWLQHALHGLHPAGYHAVNIALHAASAVLLWRLLARLGVRGAALAAIVFALHPVQVESVAWVTERKNVLSMALSLCALIAWVRAREGTEIHAGRWLWLAALAFVGAMLAKTTAVAVPVAMLAIEWWRGRAVRGSALAVVLGCLLVGVGLGLHTAHLEVEHVGAQGEEFGKPWVERLMHASQAWWFYLRTWVWPTDIVFIYPPFDLSPRSVAGWTAFVAGLAALAGAALVAWRGARGPLALLVIYSAGVFPALGFVAVWPHRYSPVADHFGYVGGVAVCVGLGWALASAWDRAVRGKGASPAARGIAAGLAALLGVLTWQACLPYQDEETLWTHTLERNDRAWIAANNLASIHLSRARAASDAGDQAALRDEALLAEAFALRAAELTDRRDMPALSNLSEALRLQGRLEEALAAAQLAVAANSRYADTLWMRARLHEQLGRTAEAGADYTEATRLAPRSPTYHHERMRFMVTQGRLQDALESATALAALQPQNAEAQGNLGNLLLANGRAAEGRAQLERTLRMAEGPLAVGISLRLCDAYLAGEATAEELQRALALAQGAVRATGEGEAGPWLALARAEWRAGRSDAARAALQRADGLAAAFDARTRAAYDHARASAAALIEPHGSP